MYPGWYWTRYTRSRVFTWYSQIPSPKLWTSRSNGSKRLGCSGRRYRASVRRKRETCDSDPTQPVRSARERQQHSKPGEELPEAPDVKLELTENSQYSRLAEIQAAEDMGQAAEAAGEETKVVKILSFFTVFYLPTSILGVRTKSPPPELRFFLDFFFAKLSDRPLTCLPIEFLLVFVCWGQQHGRAAPSNGDCG